MAIEILMPRLGWTMEEGVLAEWLKHDGDRVEPGEVIFTVESDKALQEVEAFDDGILRIPPNSPPVGSTVAVGGLLAYLTQPGEELPYFPSAAEPEILPQTPMRRSNSPSDFAPGISPQRPVRQVVSPSAPEREISPQRPVRQAVSPSAPEQTNGDHPTISPRAKRAAAQLALDWTTLTGSGRSGRIVERDVRAAATRRVEKRAVADVTPVARRAAEELGVDLSALAAQHPGRRITREDVERASLPQLKSQAAEAPAETRQPVTRIRRLIAERMSHSSQTSAPVTLTTEVDATELVGLRTHLKAAGRAPIPSYNDLFVKLVAVALAEHPVLSSRLEGDEIVQSSAAHIGLAVDSERGLLVPVIRDAGTKSIRQIAAESARLIQGARDGTLSADALSGGTFSITNLGMYEIDAFTPIINLPECAVLGIGRIVPRQVVIDAEAERVAIRQMLFLSLTFDHRIVDGAPAARFLQHVKRLVEQPYAWAIE